MSISPFATPEEKDSHKELIEKYINDFEEFAETFAQACNVRPTIDDRYKENDHNPDPYYHIAEQNYLNLGWTPGFLELGVLKTVEEESHSGITTPNDKGSRKLYFNFSSNDSSSALGVLVSKTQVEITIIRPDMDLVPPVKIDHLYHNVVVTKETPATDDELKIIEWAHKSIQELVSLKNIQQAANVQIGLPKHPDSWPNNNAILRRGSSSTSGLAYDLAPREKLEEELWIEDFYSKATIPTNKKDLTLIRTKITNMDSRQIELVKDRASEGQELIINQIKAIKDTYHLVDKHEENQYEILALFHKLIINSHIEAYAHLREVEITTPFNQSEEYIMARDELSDWIILINECMNPPLIRQDILTAPIFTPQAILTVQQKKYLRNLIKYGRKIKDPTSQEAITKHNDKIETLEWLNDQLFGNHVQTILD